MTDYHRDDGARSKPRHDAAILLGIALGIFLMANGVVLLFGERSPIVASNPPPEAGSRTTGQAARPAPAEQPAHPAPQQ